MTMEETAERDMTPEGFRHWLECRTLGICATCGEPLTGRTRRGIHASCYVMTMNMAREGFFTAEERYRDGMMDPPRRRDHLKDTFFESLKDGNSD